jgi:hypothetical protein
MIDADVEAVVKVDVFVSRVRLIPADNLKQVQFRETCTVCPELSPLTRAVNVFGFKSTTISVVDVVVLTTRG